MVGRKILSGAPLCQVLWAIAALGSAVEARAVEGPQANYSLEIQPILAENCFPCHGPDATKRQAELRLDLRDVATDTNRGDPAIVPGDSSRSEAIRRIFSDDADERMPPPDSHRTLTESQKQLLKRWVDSGATYSRHWAFVPPVRPQPPAVPSDARLKNPIDAHVVARLAAEGLAPAPEADRSALLRRVTLDLTGLPPTLEELDAFLADTAPDAYERAVDRLLDTPRFGERMVWEWLEAARYADTNGYQGDPTRPMWYWRDWAVQAYNSNLPFDEFTIEQLAGDLLPHPTQAQLIATGFHRNHMINGEGGRIAEESRVEYVQDRVETTGTVWMGLTLTCCRCHDHKFDPFTQKEYYQLAAYFNSIDETGGADLGGLAYPILSMPTPKQQQRLEALQHAESARQQQLADLEHRLTSEQPRWEQQAAAQDGAASTSMWQVLAPTELASQKGTTFTLLDDGSILAGGPSPDTDEYRLVADSGLALVTGLRLEVFPDDRLPHRGPGRAPKNGNFGLSEVTLEGGGRTVRLTAVSADFSQANWDAAFAVDGRPETGWAVHPEVGQPHTLILAVQDPASLSGGGPLTVRLSFNYGEQHTLGRLRLSVTGVAPTLFRPLPDNLRSVLAKAPDARVANERVELTRFFLDSHPEIIAARQLRDAAKRERESFERQIPRTMVMRDRAQPRETFVLAKGAYNQPREKVEHGVLSELLPLPPGTAQNRLALAQWLMAPGHPLTARVAVNRLWQQFFGVGLVKTVEDFGVQGDKPSHPELLDWLAVEFRDSGWDVKHMVRLIVTSATYRQSSHVPPGLAERDPENRLLARGPRFRLPSWMIRDQALAVAGLLVEQLGGSPVNGYQPPGVWEEATFGQIRYQRGDGAALYRRSVYTFWRRIVAPTIFFDVANRQNCTVRTGRTNTPLQALVTLNDVTYVEAARALAERTLLGSMAATDAERLSEMFRRCTARAPRRAESELLLARLTQLRAHFAQDAANATKLVGTGASHPDTRLQADELAAWTGLASVVLNLDETMTQE